MCSCKKNKDTECAKLTRVSRTDRSLFANSDARAPPWPSSTPKKLYVFSLHMSTYLSHVCSSTRLQHVSAPRSCACRNSKKIKGKGKRPAEAWSHHQTILIARTTPPGGAKAEGEDGIGLPVAVDGALSALNILYCVLYVALGGLHFTGGAAR